MALKVDNAQTKQATQNSQQTLNVSNSPATLPTEDRGALQRDISGKVVPASTPTKGAEQLTTSNGHLNHGRDAMLDSSRRGVDKVAIVTGHIIPDIAASSSPQRDAALQALKDPAIIRSYLINPDQTAKKLGEAFPDLKDAFDKNRPFTTVSGRMEPNKESSLYRIIAEGTTPGNHTAQPDDERGS